MRVVNRILIVTLLGLLAGCGSSSSSDAGGGGGNGGEPSQGAGSVIISQSPSLRLELNSTAVNASISKQMNEGKAASEVGSLSVGGCLAWAVRKNTKLHSSAMQYLKCLYSAATDAGLIDVGTGETIYVNLNLTGSDVPTRISESGGVVTISMCYDNSSAEENIRLTLQEFGNGYIVAGTSVIEDGGGQGSTPHTYVKLDTTTSGIENYIFIDHFVNQTDADLCVGASGTSLTENDTTCFLRYEGTVINNLTDSGNPLSILSGVFAEKNITSVKTTSSAYSKFMGGVGATKFAAGLSDVNSDVNETTAVDSWTPSNFVTTDPASFVNDVSGTTLVSRTATLPEIDSPWNCQPETAFTSISLSDFTSYTTSLSCVTETLNGADMTNCTGGSGELSGVVQGYLCDDNDPLIDTSGRSCP